jgi:hypothetical protein
VVGGGAICPGWRCHASDPSSNVAKVERAWSTWETKSFLDCTAVTAAGSNSEYSGPSQPYLLPWLANCTRQCAATSSACPAQSARAWQQERCDGLVRDFGPADTRTTHGVVPDLALLQCAKRHLCKFALCAARSGAMREPAQRRWDRNSAVVAAAHGLAARVRPAAKGSLPQQRATNQPACQGVLGCNITSVAAAGRGSAVAAAPQPGVRVALFKGATGARCRRSSSAAPPPQPACRSNPPPGRPRPPP